MVLDIQSWFQVTGYSWPIDSHPCMSHALRRGAVTFFGKPHFWIRLKGQMSAKIGQNPLKADSNDTAPGGLYMKGGGKSYDMALVA